MFDSPIAYCSFAKAYVLLDQTPRECVREHGCREACPLRKFFVKYCPLRDVHVVLDQTARQCAREHACEALRCPLRRFFAGIELQAPGPTVPAMDRSYRTSRRHLHDNLLPT
jgi:hypothetical protein